MTKGTNFFKVGAVKLNQERTQFDVYPVYTDTTGGDSTIYKGNNSINLTLGYHYALTDNFTIGIESRFLSSEESSYGIKAGGLSFRYYFSLKKPEEAKMKFAKTDEPATNFFFIDATGLYGGMRYKNITQSYYNGILQLGLSVRVPFPETKFVRHLGIELSLGGSYRTTVNNETKLLPIAHAGVHFYLDKNYTK